MIKEVFAFPPKDSWRTCADNLQARVPFRLVASNAET